MGSEHVLTTPDRAAMGNAGCMTVEAAYAGMPWDDYTFRAYDYDGWIVTGIEKSHPGYLLHNPNWPDGVQSYSPTVLYYKRNERPGGGSAPAPDDAAPFTPTTGQIEEVEQAISDAYELADGLAIGCDWELKTANQVCDALREGLFLARLVKRLLAERDEAQKALIVAKLGRLPTSEENMIGTPENAAMHAILSAPQPPVATPPAAEAGYASARGVLAGLDEEPAEVSVRRLRDGAGPKAAKLTDAQWEALSIAATPDRVTDFTVTVYGSNRNSRLNNWVYQNSAKVLVTLGLLEMRNYSNQYRITDAGRKRYALGRAALSGTAASLPGGDDV